eukprot:2856253-Amphidinium_carterae.3
MSRLGATILQFYALPHKQYPVRLYKLLEDPSLAHVLSSDPPCLKDAFTLQLEAAYPGLQDPTVLAILHMQATRASVDIASTIEARHASVRRQVVLRSTQTWSCTFKRASAEFLVQQFRKLAANKPGSNKRTKADEMNICTTTPPPNQIAPLQCL